MNIISRDGLAAGNRQHGGEYTRPATQGLRLCFRTGGDSGASRGDHHGHRWSGEGRQRGRRSGQRFPVPYPGEDSHLVRQTISKQPELRVPLKPGWSRKPGFGHVPCDVLLEPVSAICRTAY